MHVDAKYVCGTKISTRMHSIWVEQQYLGYRAGGARTHGLHGNAGGGGHSSLSDIHTVVAPMPEGRNQLSRTRPTIGVV